MLPAPCCQMQLHRSLARLPLQAAQRLRWAEELPLALCYVQQQAADRQQVHKRPATPLQLAEHPMHACHTAYAVPALELWAGRLPPA